jgi:predicted PurR-regulated permease PerM
MSDGWKMILMLVSMAVLGLIESFLIIRSVQWLERRSGKDKAKRVIGVVAVSLGILMIVAPYLYLFLTWPK